MVYSNKFVMAILLDGLPVKELANGTVQLPFGCEYSLRFRNKNNVRAVVKIYVDGENVSGNGYIVPANDCVDIKRHSEKDCAFKFVSLESGDAIEHGKNGPNLDKSKGVIEARFYLEKPQLKSTVHHYHHYYNRPPAFPKKWTHCTETPICDNPQSAPYMNHRSSIGSSDVERQVFGTVSSNCSAYDSFKLPASIPSPLEQSLELKDGCTVEGHATGQSFYRTEIDVEETCTTLKVFLQGYNPGRYCPPAPQMFVEKYEATNIEKENEKIRLQIALLENEKLKKQLAELSK